MQMVISIGASIVGFVGAEKLGESEPRVGMIL